MCRVILEKEKLGRRASLEVFWFNFKHFKYEVKVSCLGIYKDGWKYFELQFMAVKQLSAQRLKPRMCKVIKKEEKF